MQLKNALIAAAVTAALAASATVSAETTIYGKIHTSIASVAEDTGATDTSSMEIKSNASRFGIKASKELENGMTFNGQFEFEVDAAGDVQKSGDDSINIQVGNDLNINKSQLEEKND